MTCMRAWMSSKFGGIRLPTTALAAIERMSHSTKMKEFGRKIVKKITHLIFIFIYFNLNSEHLKTIIHSFRQENSNNNNFRFILMVAHVKCVIPVTTTRNFIS